MDKEETENHIRAESLVQEEISSTTEAEEESTTVNESPPQTTEANEEDVESTTVAITEREDYESTTYVEAKTNAVSMPIFAVSAKKPGNF